MNLAERIAANDDYGYDEDSVHALLKKLEVCGCKTFNTSLREAALFERIWYIPVSCRISIVRLFKFSYWKRKLRLMQLLSSHFMIRLTKRWETRIRRHLKWWTVAGRK